MTTLLSEEQLLLRSSAREMLAGRYPMTWVREWTEADLDHRRELHRALWKDLAELGWLGLALPEEIGGSGLGAVEQTIILEELGRAVLPSPYLETLLAAAALAVGSNDDLRGETLSAIATGERCITLALDEETGDDPAEWTTRAATAGDRSALHGQKAYVPYAPLADRLLVSAKDEGGDLGLFLVDATDPATVCIRGRETMDATRPLYVVELSGALGTRIGDFAFLFEAIQPMHWAGLAAEGVGGCERVLADAVAYAKERVQFGTPIGSNQAIKHKCSNMLVRTEGARAITYHAARSRDAAAQDAALACSMAKAYATEAYRDVSSEGIQIHGGVGFTWEFDCHFFYKRARANEIAGGHPDEHRERVAVGAGL